MITNELLTVEERKLLNFFLSNIDSQKKKIIGQINASNIMRDHSPYHLILKFDAGNSNAEKITGYRFDSTIQVLHDDAAPTVFILFIEDGVIREFEAYNADLSCLDLDKLFEGEVFKEF